MTEVRIFALPPLKFMLTSFVKRFSKKLCIKLNLFCDFFGLKTCKDDSYMQNENLFIKKIP